VAHPDLVPVAMEVFDGVLADQPNQLTKQRPEVAVQARDLLDVRVPDGAITEAGLRANISVGIQYIASWLRGVGAAAIFNLMEDAATAEISRSQVWQWTRHEARLQEGQTVTRELVRDLEGEEMQKIQQAVGERNFSQGRFTEAAALFEQVALSEDFVEFLTIPAYDHIDL
jgi:malate synthase